MPINDDPAAQAHFRKTRYVQGAEYAAGKKVHNANACPRHVCPGVVRAVASGTFLEFIQQHHLDRSDENRGGRFIHTCRKIDTGDALLAQSNQQKPPSQGGPSYTPSYDINKAMGMGSKGGAGVSAAAPNKGTATGKDPIKVFGDAEEAGWDLSEREKQGVRLAVEYLRKKAAEKAESDPDMANLLEMYAQRILIAKIDRADKPFLASGQASTSRFTGTITLYDSFIDGNGNTFNLTPRPLENYDKRELEEIAGVASSLMHEVAHSLAGASEWQSHLLQKITFDALGISEEKDIRKFNKNYFETFDSPLGSPQRIPVRVLGSAA
jgi:hypothetical protein